MKVNNTLHNDIYFARYLIALNLPPKNLECNNTSPLKPSKIDYSNLL